MGCVGRAARPGWSGPGAADGLVAVVHVHVAVVGIEAHVNDPALFDMEVSGADASRAVVNHVGSRRGGQAAAAGTVAVAHILGIDQAPLGVDAAVRVAKHVVLGKIGIVGVQIAVAARDFHRRSPASGHAFYGIKDIAISIPRIIPIDRMDVPNSIDGADRPEELAVAGGTDRLGRPGPGRIAPGMEQVFVVPAHP